MLIIGGVQTPFVLDVTFRGDDTIDTTIRQEFDTLPEARAALEGLVLDNQDHVHDFIVGLRGIDLLAGDLVKFDFVDVIDPKRPDRPARQRSKNVAVGVWSISWRKPEPSLADLRARLASA